MKKLFVIFLLLSGSALAAKNPAQKFEETTTFATPKQFATNGFADIVEELLPSVVNISAAQEMSVKNDNNTLVDLPKTPFFEDFRNQLENQFRGGGRKKSLSSIGSGFIISKDGFVVTNNHVIEEAKEITVGLYDGSKYKAKVIGIDKKTDLALLKINPNRELKFAKFGDSSKARIGEWIIAVGNPYGLGGSVSVGIISARGRDINSGQSDELIQTDAAINKGNSGGPLFNSKGEVIGISTAIFSPSGGNVGIGFATPSATATQVVQQLKEQGEVVRGWVGISVQDINEEIAESMKMEVVSGAFVVEVTPDSPAEKAGILPTDIIAKIDDDEITEMRILPKIISQYPVGKIAKFTLLRQGKIKVLKVKVEKMREDDDRKSDTKVFRKEQIIKPAGELLGLGLAEVSSKVKKGKSESNSKGLLVVETNPKSEAVEKGVMAGDIILSANQIPVSSIDELKKIIDDTKKSTKKLFLFLRRGESNYPVGINIK